MESKRECPFRTYLPCYSFCILTQHIRSECFRKLPFKLCRHLEPTWRPCRQTPCLRTLPRMHRATASVLPANDVLCLAVARPLLADVFLKLLFESFVGVDWRGWFSSLRAPGRAEGTNSLRKTHKRHAICFSPVVFCGRYHLERSGRERSLSVGQCCLKVVVGFFLVNCAR